MPVTKPRGPVPASPPRSGPPKDPRARTKWAPLPDMPPVWLAWGLVGLVILLGHLAAPYVADPARIPKPTLFVVAGLLTFVVGAATATLTTLLWIMPYLRSLPEARGFLAAFGNYTAVGAAVGSVLGLRMTGPLFFARQGHYGFADMLGTISDMVTLGSLLLQMVPWALSLGRVYPIYQARFPEDEPRARSFTFLVLSSGNAAGLYAGAATWRILTS